MQILTCDFYDKPLLKFERLLEVYLSYTPRGFSMLGDVFKQNTSDYFFPSDGHFSVKGNEKLAEFLLTQ